MKNKRVNSASFSAVAITFILGLSVTGCTRNFIHTHSAQYPHPFVFSFSDSLPGSRTQLYDKAYSWAKAEFTGDIPIYYDSISKWKWYKTDHSVRETLILCDEQNGKIIAQGYMIHSIPSFFGYSGYDYIIYRMTITVGNGSYTALASNFTHRSDTRYDVSGRDYGPLDSDRVQIRFPFGYDKDYYRMKKFAAQSIQVKFEELKKAMHKTS